jgi:hypothetical protein
LKLKKIELELALLVQYLCVALVFVMLAVCLLVQKNAHKECGHFGFKALSFGLALTLRGLFFAPTV